RSTPERGGYNRPVNSRARTAAFAVLIVGYFLYFSWDRLGVRFSPDDMMNLSYHWSFRPVQLLVTQVAIWQGIHRSMGGLFYSSIFGIFGLNPVPFHIGMAAFELGVVCLLYRLARQLQQTQ